MLLYIIISIISVLFVLFSIAVLNAIRLKKDYTNGNPYDMEKDGISPEKHAKNLSEMIKIPTVSVRGNADLTYIYKMHEKLEELYPLIHSNLEKVNLDGALLFKWEGKNPDRLPILLMSHHDVVEATGKWKYPAFSGEIAKGKIWGRGSIDTKGALCAILESVEYLLSIDFIPSCDVYIASSCNEEITGDGAVKTVDYLYKKGIKLDLVMDEGGSIMGDIFGGNAQTAMVGIFEKGRANIKFIAKSHGGHASIPFRRNPFARLAKLIYKLEKRPPFKKKITAPVKKMYKEMVPYMPFKYRFILGNIWLFGWILPFAMSKMGGQANALISTTCVFTQAEGSSGANVIPEEASVTANMRFMIHEPLEQSLKKVLKIAQKNNIWMEMISGYDIPPVADMDTYAYRQVLLQIRETFGDIPVIPYVMLAGTDARHYTKICDCVLRFVPLTMTDAQMKSAHAVDENLDVSSLARAVNYYVDFIRNYDNIL
ncbi:MAG: M20/M25/M40 family metallo-hydrolase [Clostridiales bacterium]|nr:M20/M25/M40 family metallo-hydrolase [Clostridiales bacterium]